MGNLYYLRANESQSAETKKDHLRLSESKYKESMRIYLFFICIQIRTYITYVHIPTYIYVCIYVNTTSYFRHFIVLVLIWSVNGVYAIV